MHRITKSPTGSALAIVILILGIIVIALLVFRTELRKTFYNKASNVSVDQYIERETHFFGHDDYVVKFVIWNDAEEPLSGKIELHLTKAEGQFRSLGDDLAKDGEIDANSATIRTTDWKLGKNNAKTVYYVFSSPKLNESNLSPEEVAKRAPMQGWFHFYPPSDSLFDEVTRPIGFSGN